MSNLAVRQTETIDGFLVAEHEDEPRIRDLELAERLGYERPREIRRLVQRLEEDIGVCVTVTQTSGPEGGRPGIEYWLTERQALIVCSQSRTKAALKVTKAVIDVFLAFKRGQITLSTETSLGTAESIKLLAREIVAPVLERVDQRFDTVQVEVNGIKQRLTLIEGGKGKRLSRLGADRKDDQYVIRERFQDKCPGCFRWAILDANGEYLPGVEEDHWNHSSDRGAYSMWPLCKDCHTRRTASEGKTQFHASFECWIRIREETLAESSPKPAQPTTKSALVFIPTTGNALPIRKGDLTVDEQACAMALAEAKGQPLSNKQLMSVCSASRNNEATSPARNALRKLLKKEWAVKVSPGVHKTGPYNPWNSSES